MSTQPSRLSVHPAPFLKGLVSTPRIMRDVLLASLVVLAISTVVFGLSALLVTGVATLGAVGAEWLFGGRRSNSLGDWSAVLTGVLLGLTLPPGFPLWMALLGGVVGVGMGKAIWGGLGQNLFNPALVGRAFLQAAFPTTITTWSAHSQGVAHVNASLFALPLMSPPPQPVVDGFSGATPLGVMKFSDDLPPAMLDMLLGNIGGSLGETSALVLILVGAWLAWRRAFDWRIPVSIAVSVFVFAAIPWLIAPGSYPAPWFMVVSGGLLFGAVFMATDPVTSPMAPKGAWVFGAGIGALVVLIRLWGGLPEGVMYAILLMNAVTPHLNRAFQPRPFGRKSGRAQ